MENRKTNKSYSPEFRARAVRLAQEQGGEHAWQWAAIPSTAGKIGCDGMSFASPTRASRASSLDRRGVSSPKRTLSRQPQTSRSEPWAARRGEGAALPREKSSPKEPNAQP